MRANPHSGEYLEVLGKNAAARWSSGAYKTLTESVTQQVKQAQLSPEQVKRVVEFANTAAFLDAFKKEGAAHHVIEFAGGPADASEILKDLNDGGGGSVFDRGTLDYSSAPSETKHASAHDEAALATLFGAEGQEKTAAALPHANPYAEVIQLKDKLAGVAEHLQSQVSGLEVMYSDLADRLYQQVKQASLGGFSLSQVMKAWEAVSPGDEYIKVAFELFTPRLLREGVFHQVEDMVASLEKNAGAGLVNPEHPLVVDFGEYCDVLSKLATSRAARAEVRGHLASLTEYLKTASTVGDAWRGARNVAGSAAEASRPFLQKHLGETAGDALAAGIKYAPHAGVGIGAMEVNRRIENSPSVPARAARATKNIVLRNIPGTQENLMEQYRIQGGG